VKLTIFSGILAGSRIKVSRLIEGRLRAASPKYQLDLEIAKKSHFSKLAQNEALPQLVTKILF